MSCDSMASFTTGEAPPPCGDGAPCGGCCGDGMGDEPKLGPLLLAFLAATALVMHCLMTQVRANDGQLFTTPALCHVLLS